MFDISFDTGSAIRMFRALRRLQTYTPMVLDEMQRKCSVEMRDLLVENILNQKFAYTYWRYNERYGKWKEEMVGNKGFWRLYDDLLKNITSFRLQVELNREVWAAGIPPGVMDKGGKSWFGTPQRPRGKAKPIAMYARILEYGGDFGKGGKHHARPLFTPTTFLYATSGWQKRGKETLRSVGSYWA